MTDALQGLGSRDGHTPFYVLSGSFLGTTNSKHTYAGRHTHVHAPTRTHAHTRTLSLLLGTGTCWASENEDALKAGNTLARCEWSLGVEVHPVLRRECQPFWSTLQQDAPEASGGTRRHRGVWQRVLHKCLRITRVFFYKTSRNKEVFFPRSSRLYTARTLNS